MTRLKIFRERLGWTQIQLAVRAGVSRETVRKLERGGIGPTSQLGVVFRVAHALGLSPADVFPVIRERPAKGSRRRE